MPGIRGLDLDQIRAGIYVTVLTKQGKDWEDKETDRLTSTLATNAKTHPEHPRVLILRGNFSLGAVEGALIHPNFQYEVVRGLDKPDLPFTFEIDE